MHDLLNNTFVSVALIVIGFGFLIFVHELGHFLVAKMVGVKTTQFAIGFGNSLLTWRKGIGFRVGTTEPEYEKLLKEGADPKTLGETEYRLNYIPLGGYVKMLGQEDMDPTARSEDPRAFNNKSVSARFAVISAGVIMNLIFGMIFFVIAFMSGVKFPPAIVGAIAPDSPAAVTYADGHEGDPDYLGLKLDDHITSIDGKPVGDMMDVKYATILARGGASLDMSVERPGLTNPLTYHIKPEVNKDIGLFSIGINPPNSLDIADVADNSPAYGDGITDDMTITAVDGNPVKTYAQFDQAVAEKRGEPADITFTDEKTGKTVSTRVAAFPDMTSKDDSAPNLLGLVPPIKITYLSPDMPAKDSGMQPGDLIADIDGAAWPDAGQFLEAIQNAPEKGIRVTVLRDGQFVDLKPITPTRKKKIGAGIMSGVDQPVVGQTLPDSPMQEATMIAGSKLLTANGQPVHSFRDLQRILEKLPPNEPAEVKLTFELNLPEKPQESQTVSLSKDQVDAIVDAGWTASLPIGATPGVMQVRVAGDNPWQATVLGFKKTQQFITQTYTTLLRLFQRTVPVNKMSGPVGIVHQGTIIAERGWEYLFFFLGLISVNLAVINFLPIPITDGGQAVFLALEKIKGSPVSVKVQTAATIVGLALLACVFLFVTYNDVLNLLGMS